MTQITTYLLTEEWQEQSPAQDDQRPKREEKDAERKAGLVEVVVSVCHSLWHPLFSTQPGVGWKSLAEQRGSQAGQSQTAETKSPGPFGVGSMRMVPILMLGSRFTLLSPTQAKIRLHSFSSACGNLPGSSAGLIAWQLPFYQKPLLAARNQPGSAVWLPRQMVLMVHTEALLLSPSR